MVAFKLRCLIFAIFLIIFKVKSVEKKTTLNKVKAVAKNLFAKSTLSSKKTKSSIKKIVTKKHPKNCPIKTQSNDFSDQNQDLPDYDAAFLPSTKLYGKVTDAMKKQGAKGYEWNTKPEPESLPPFDFFSDVPKLNPVVDGCEKEIDFFNILLNDDMVDYICLHSNEKLVREKIRKLSINLRKCFEILQE